ncbi:MAG: saccharopine dehydrogenase NADP-binding domain-containing protein [Pseudomonadota bacterium]
MDDRPYDLILYGATGFTGRLVAEHLAARIDAGSPLRWAIAGRSDTKLQELRETLSESGAGNAIDVLTAESDDPASLHELARSTRVLCSTVGPYAMHGSDLVESCAREGTDYCDLTGEVHWIAEMIEAHQESAQESGARIVHSCGFDSIPSDLGTWFVQESLREAHGVYAQRVRGRVGKTRGSASGGTIASMLGVVAEAGRDAELRRRLQDKYLLYPAGEAPGPKQRDQFGPVFDSCFSRWTAPFVMAVINERIVRRSNALLEFSWGRDFNYDESLLCGSRAQALAISLGMGAGMLTVASSPGRRLAQRFLPSPGEGPDRAAREAGFFELFFHAEHPEKPDLGVRARVRGDRDPGYGATSRMLGEAALCLAEDSIGVDGGFWTPASAMAGMLLPRLEKNAGLSFELVEGD